MSLPKYEVVLHHFCARDEGGRPVEEVKKYEHSMFTYEKYIGSYSVMQCIYNCMVQNHMI